jgi:hypothetical protein
MNHSAQRRVGVVALASAFAFAPLSGCAPPVSESIDDSPTPRAAPASPSATSGDPTVIGPPEDLTFEAGDDLAVDSVRVEWTDPFATDAEFSVRSPDDGNGSWSYTDDTNRCAVSFYQGSLTDFVEGSGDRASTIDALGSILESSDARLTAATVEQYGEAYDLRQSPKDGTVEFWGISAVDTDESGHVSSARYFTRLDRIQLMNIQCPPGTSVFDESQRVIVDKAIALHVSEVGD